MFTAGTTAVQTAALVKKLAEAETCAWACDQCGEREYGQHWQNTWAMLATKLVMTSKASGGGAVN